MWYLWEKIKILNKKPFFWSSAFSNHNTIGVVHLHNLFLTYFYTAIGLHYAA